MIHVETIPYSRDNFAYLLACPESGELAVVDPGDFSAVKRVLESTPGELKAVFCTHHHGDHVAGLGQLLDAFPDLRVYGHRLDQQRIQGLTDLLEDGDRVHLGHHTGHVIHTPGHTRGSICYFFDGHAFTGDTLFAAGCGRLFEGDATTMSRGLTTLTRALETGTHIHFGHEYTRQNLQFALTVEPENPHITQRLNRVQNDSNPGSWTTPTTLEMESTTNPFLRCDAPAIIRTAKKEDPTCTGEEADVFRVIRSMKDRF